jgi:hypothetical protein
MERPWFTRAWIYPELVLSKSPRIQARKFSYSWEEFILLLTGTPFDLVGSQSLARKSIRVRYMLFGMVSVCQNPDLMELSMARLSSNFEQLDEFVTDKRVIMSNSLQTYNHHRAISIEQVTPNPGRAKGLGVTDACDVLYAYLGLVRGPAIVVGYSVP